MKNILLHTITEEKLSSETKNKILSIIKKNKLIEHEVAKKLKQLIQEDFFILKTQKTKRFKIFKEKDINNRLLAKSLENVESDEEFIRASALLKRILNVSNNYITLDVNESLEILKRQKVDIFYAIVEADTINIYKTVNEKFNLEFKKQDGESILTKANLAGESLRKLYENLYGNNSFVDSVMNFWFKDEDVLKEIKQISSSVIIKPKEEFLDYKYCTVIEYSTILQTNSNKIEKFITEIENEDVPELQELNYKFGFVLKNLRKICAGNVGSLFSLVFEDSKDSRDYSFKSFKKMIENGPKEDVKKIYSELKYYFDIFYDKGSKHSLHEVKKFFKNIMDRKFSLSKFFFLETFSNFSRDEINLEYINEMDTFTNIKTIEEDMLPIIIKNISEYKSMQKDLAMYPNVSTGGDDSYNAFIKMDSEPKIRTVFEYMPSVGSSSNHSYENIQFHLEFVQYLIKNENKIKKLLNELKNEKRNFEIIKGIRE